MCAFILLVSELVESRRERSDAFKIVTSLDTPAIKPT